jgi:hypothetical protein
MTSQLESLIQQAFQLDRDERIELITHVANSLHSNNDPTLETSLTEFQQSQIDRVGVREAFASAKASALLNRLRSEIEIGLEQVRTGDTVDGETVFANLKTRIDRYREPK